MRVGLQYVRQSARLRTVLLRVALFFLQSTALIALLPLVARGFGDGGGSARTFTLLLACLGIGAIVSATVLQRIRQRVSLDATGAHRHAGAGGSDGGRRLRAQRLGGGAGDDRRRHGRGSSVANTLTVSAQMALPDWVRARGMSIFQMALMGSSAVGAALWGQVATLTSVRTSLRSRRRRAAWPACCWRGGARCRARQRGRPDAVVPASVPPSATLPFEPAAGPVMVTIEYRIDPERARGIPRRHAREPAQPAAPAARSPGSCSTTLPIRATTSSTSSTRPGSSTCAASTASPPPMSRCATAASRCTPESIRRWWRATSPSRSEPCGRSVLARAPTGRRLESQP